MCLSLFTSSRRCRTVSTLSSRRCSSCMDSVFDSVGRWARSANRPALPHRVDTESRPRPLLGTAKKWGRSGKAGWARISQASLWGRRASFWFTVQHSLPLNPLLPSRELTNIVEILILQLFSCGADKFTSVLGRASYDRLYHRSGSYSLSLLSAHLRRCLKFISGKTKQAMGYSKHGFTRNIV